MFLFPASGALKPPTPYAWFDGHLRARPGRPDRGGGRRRARPEALFSPRHGVGTDPDPRMREVPDPGPRRPPPPDARGTADRDAGTGPRARPGRLARGPGMADR